jgi:hypothetical protein
MADPAYIVDGVLTDSEAWVGLGTTTLGSDTASVTFTSTDDGQVGDFSQYMDLVAVTYTRADDGYLRMRFNGDAGSNYQIQELKGTGAAASASSYATSNVVCGVGISTAKGANEFAAGYITIFDINSGKYKSVVSQVAADSNGDGNISLNAAAWKSQAAITSVAFVITSGTNFIAASQFSLFGVLPRMVA